MPRFQALQAEESAQIHDAGLIDVTLPLVDGLVDRLRSGIDVIDVGCGHGHAANLIADAFPASRSPGSTSPSKASPRRGPRRTSFASRTSRFEVRDALSLEPASYDLVTAFDVIHDLPRPAETLAAIHAALRADGIFLMVDIAASSQLHENLAHPLGPALYTASIFHCMTVSLANDGPGLGTMWGRADGARAAARGRLRERRGRARRSRHHQRVLHRA